MPFAPYDRCALSAVAELRVLLTALCTFSARRLQYVRDELLIIVPLWENTRLLTADVEPHGY